MTKKHQKLWAAVLIVLIATYARLSSLALMPDISGDREGYSHYAVYTLASGLKFCRSLFGENSRCGLQLPQHEFLVDAFNRTGMTRYLTGEIEFDKLVGIPDQLQMNPLKTPIETLLSNWNATALTLGGSIWLFGGDYAGFLLLESVLLALAGALVFEMAYRLSNLLGGVLAGGGWVLYSLGQFGQLLLPQPLASVLIILGMLALVYGMRYKHGLWLLAGCAANGLAGFYAIGHRPAMLLLLPLLLSGYYLARRAERTLAIWPFIWLACVGLFAAGSFFTRTQPGADGQPLTFPQHLAHVFTSDSSSASFSRPFSSLEREGWRTVSLPPDTSDSRTLAALVADLFKDPGAWAKALPIKLYQFWSIPVITTDFWLPIHQTLILLSFAGLFLLTGYQDWRGGLGWIFFASLVTSTFAYGYINIETRYALPFLGPLFAMGGALLGQFILSLKRFPLSLLLTGIGVVIIAVMTITYLNLSVLSILLAGLPTRFLFAIVLTLQLILLVGMLTWLVWPIKPHPWRWVTLVAPLGATLVIFSMGQWAGHWRQWELPLSQGLVARQVITLPAQLSSGQDELPWLLFDTAPGDNFEVRLNGQVIKAANQPLLAWQAENNQYARLWQGLPLDPTYLQPGATLTVEIYPIGQTPVTLYGDFPSDDPATYVGPAIDYRGDYRSIWRERWSPIDESRITKPFDFKGVTYQSSLRLADGQPLANDLSPILGRQHGLFRIFLGAFDLSESPPPPATDSILAALSAQMITPNQEVILYEAGAPKLRFLGHRLDYPVEENKARLNLYFATLDLITADYLIYLQGRAQDIQAISAAETADLFNYFNLSLPNSEWQKDRIYRESFVFQINPAMYDLSFRFSGYDDPQQHLSLDHDELGTVSLGQHQIADGRATAWLPDFVAALDWIDQNIPGPNLVLTTYILPTRSDEILIPFLDPQRNIAEQVINKQVYYLIYVESSAVDQHYLDPLLKTYAAYLSPIHQADGWRVYKLSYKG